MALVDLSHDSLIAGRITILQPKRGYRAAIDPVFLAAAVPARPGERILDLGCGVGSAALCLLARVEGIAVVGVDNQPDLVDLAARNASENTVAERFRAILADVVGPSPELALESFDHVMANPPYLPASRARDTKASLKRAATVEGEADLATWTRMALAMVKPKGTVTFVHRADRLDAILAALYGVAGGIVTYPLWPGVEKPAKRVIVQARKAVASPARLSSGMVLHKADGSYTKEAEGILREARALDIG